MTDNWQEQRRRKLRVWHGRCEDCGDKPTRPHVHHIVPRSKGGTHELSNLKAVCTECHAAEHDAYACDICGGVVYDYGQGWLADRKGAFPAGFCPECREIIKIKSDESGCSVCNRTDVSFTQKAGIYWADEQDGETPPPTYDVCNECRKNIPNTRLKKTNTYLARVGALADFKHWETDNGASESMNIALRRIEQDIQDGGGQ